MPGTLYSDPRLVALYDAINPFADDTRFYLDLAARTRSTRIVDIGCGTGLLACELAQRGCAVTGVDPSRAMLEVARSRAGADRVEWIEGDAASLGKRNADLAVMTGHVAQVFLDDASFDATLAAAHDALRPGGHLAFESRHPLAAAWAAWTPERSRRTIHDPQLGEVETWHQVIDRTADRVRFETIYRFLKDDDTVVAASELRFRTQSALTEGLSRGGFRDMAWAGDWSGAPVGPTSRELIVVATRA
jgi:SAM-dependent methyltransferase